MTGRCIFLLLVITLVPYFASANSQNQKFQEANGAYSTNDFTAAIAIYESLIAEHGYSPGVLYNLANSYAQTDAPGLAILNYERALRISPGNSDILANLEKVRNEHGLFSEDSSLATRLAQSLSMDQWGLLTLVAFSAIALTIASSLYLKVSRRTMTLVCTGAGALLLLAVSCMTTLRKDWHCSIITETAPMLISPFEGAASIGTANAGRKVFPQKYHGSYVYTVGETGHSGWLHASTIQPVVK